MGRPTKAAEQANEPKLGDVFGRLEVVGGITRRKVGPKSISMKYIPVRCKCGTEKTISVSSLVHRTRSCGCLVAEKAREMGKARKTHGDGGAEKTRSKLYSVWSSALRRCSKPSGKDAKSYHDKGIEVCDEWKRSYKTFRAWALSSGYEEGLRLTRKNKSLGFNPENCCWETFEESRLYQSNTHWLTAFGESKSVSEWLRDSHCKVNDKNFRARMKMGWDIERIINTPVRPKRPRQD